MRGIIPIKQIISSVVTYFKSKLFSLRSKKRSIKLVIIIGKMDFPVVFLAVKYPPRKQLKITAATNIMSENSTVKFGVSPNEKLEMAVKIPTGIIIKSATKTPITIAKKLFTISFPI